MDCTVEQNLCHQMGVSGYPTIRMYPRGSKGGDDILIKPNKSLINSAIKTTDPYPYAGWIAGSNRYQPYHGNRRDVTSLHNWLQVKKIFYIIAHTGVSDCG